jgi:hypothetical protein
MNKEKDKLIEELRDYNKVLEQSPEYQRILPEVMNEVYTLFVNEEIERSERYLAREDKDEDDALLHYINHNVKLP